MIFSPRSVTYGAFMPVLRQIIFQDGDNIQVDPDQGVVFDTYPRIGPALAVRAIEVVLDLVVDGDILEYLSLLRAFGAVGWDEH